MTKRDANETDAAMRNRTWKLIAARMGLLAGVIVILTVGLELATRMLSNVEPPIIMRDAKVGTRFPRSYEGEFHIAETNERVRLRFNRVGFRGPDRPLEKQAGTVRVAVMGDSMIASLAMVEEELMTTKLEKMLNAAQPSRNWEVLNFGVSGASTSQQIALYREEVSNFDPDIVLSCFFVGNDLSDNSPQLSRNPRIYFDFDQEGNFQQLPHSVSRSNLSRWLNRNSRFYVWQKRATQIARHRVRKEQSSVRSANLIYAKEENDNVAHAWRITAKAIEVLHQEVTADDRMFAVVMVPTAEQVYLDLMDQLTTATAAATESFDVNHPDRRLREICQQIDVEFWSMKDDFCTAAPARSYVAQEEWLFLAGKGHFNEMGNTAAAESVYQFLSQQQANQLADHSLVQRAVKRR